MKAKVYINADLTKAQSIAAYKICYQRRKRALARLSYQPGDSQSASGQAMGNMQDHSALNVEACPFAPSDGESLRQ